jgi:hypothetical protein
MVELFGLSVMSAEITETLKNRRGKAVRVKVWEK